jgi:acetylornithine deacetylase/succinyl-diaminopimelate desuccinylase-like protein
VPIDEEQLRTYIAAHRERHLAELLDFLSIPSVSALPDHRDDVRRAAAWLAERVRAAGVPEVQVLETGGHPVVLGRWHVDDRRPTVLIYGHYDVQPADPLALWTSPPFEPAVRDDRVYARGASDDKGNLFAALKAVEAVHALAGRPPVNLVLLFEGEEEIGSPSLGAFAERQRALLAADVIVSADGSMAGPDTPAMNLGTRGIAACQVDVYGARTDLHSGGHGGAAPNPIHALVHVLAAMRGADGRITVEGFYDDVVEPTAEERALVAALPYSEEAYRAELGIEATFGEPGYTDLERRSLRPTLEVNGIWGGFQGEGTKTVLPREAHAKITCRLVPNQDPEAILDAIERHVRRHLTPGVRAEVRRFDGNCRAYRLDRRHPAVAAAHQVLERVYGQPPVYTYGGGTLPLASLFKEKLGLDLVMFAFGSPDEGAHAPDEFFRLSSFRRAVAAYPLLLEALATALR